MPDHTQFQDTNGNAARRFTRWIWMGAFLLSGGVAGGVLNGLHPGLWPGIAILLVPCALLLAMIREVRRNAVAKGCATPAGQHYQQRLRIWGPGYIFAIFGAIWLFRYVKITGPVLWIVAFLPSLPILGIIWSMGRYLIDENDEYQRAKFVFSSMVATGGLLTISTVWGFFENFGLVKHLEAYVAFPVWALGLSIGRLIHRWRQA